MWPVMKSQNFNWPRLNIIIIINNTTQPHCLALSLDHILLCIQQTSCCDLCFIHILLCGHNTQYCHFPSSENKEIHYNIYVYHRSNITVLVDINTHLSKLAHSRTITKSMSKHEKRLAHWHSMTISRILSKLSTHKYMEIHNILSNNSTIHT